MLSSDLQALWRTLRNPSDSIAQVAFRVLGKFGGGNRKMLREPQKVFNNVMVVLFFISLWVLNLLKLLTTYNYGDLQNFCLFSVEL